MLYPSYRPYTAADSPNVLHYGLLFEVEGTGFKFDKPLVPDLRRPGVPALGPRQVRPPDRRPLPAPAQPAHAHHAGALLCQALP